MLRASTILLILAVAAAPTFANPPSEIVGAWRVLGTDEQGKSRGAVLYVEEKDGQLTGRWNTGSGSIELRDVLYQDGRLTCWWYVDIQRTLIKLYFTADFDGDTFTGELKEPHAVGKLRGKRIGTKPVEEKPAEPTAGTEGG